MATSLGFVDYVCEQLQEVWNIRYRKMFGEYMVYVNDKPIVLICDDTVFVKKISCIEEKMKDALVGFPYQGAREHYILDVDQRDFCKEIVTEVERVTPLPKKKIQSKINWLLIKTLMLKSFSL